MSLRVVIQLKNIKKVNIMRMTMSQSVCVQYFPCVWLPGLLLWRSSSHMDTCELWTSSGFSTQRRDQSSYQIRVGQTSVDVEICRGPGPWGFAARMLRENFVASLFGLLLEGLYLCDLNIWDCVSIWIFVFCVWYRVRVGPACGALWSLHEFTMI